MKIVGYVLGLIGIVLTAILFVKVFIPPAQNGLGIILGNPAPAGSPQFMQTLSNLIGAPVEQGESITPIETGDEFLAVLLNSINNASTSINFTTYPWSPGKMNAQILSALEGAAKRGVQVRVLIDALGGHTMTTAELAPLATAGAHIAFYHPFSLWNPFQYDERDHMRAIVIDGSTGYFGGMGVGDDWIGDGVTEGWSDMMFEVNGAMVQNIQGAFANLWNQATGEVLSGPAFYPPNPTIQSVESFAAVTSSTTNTFIPVTSIPSEDSEPIRDTFLYTLASAQKSIYIINPFIVPDQYIISTLENKARSGVDVEIISPGDKTNAPLMRDAWRSNYDGLLAAGVKIYEYDPQMIHTKIMVVDDSWSVIGSANLDSRSEMLNDENDMGIEDPTFAGQLMSVFAEDASHSTQITEAQWSQQGWFSKALDWSVTLFAKQL